MISIIWFLGMITFFIYDAVIGFDFYLDGPIKYFGLAIFWFISIPIFIFKWLKETFLSRKNIKYNHE